jgi:hypothetical protein
VILQRAQLSVSLQEDILTQVHRFIPVSNHPEDEVINGLFPLPDQRIEAFRIAAEGALDEVSVSPHDSKTPLSLEKTNWERNEGQ